MSVEGGPIIESEHDGTGIGLGASSTRAREWTARLARYRATDNLKACRQLSGTALAFFALWVLMWFSLDHSYLATLLLSLPTAGFLLRLFIIQHDCGHRSFVSSGSANDALGVALSVLTLTPFHHWRRNHLLHHASSGDLDRRGHGDIRMLTTGEYLQRSPGQRFWYRMFRNPWFLFFVAPVFHFVVMQRFPYYTAWSWKKAPPVRPDDAQGWKKEQQSVYLTNILVCAMVLVVGLVVGFQRLVAVHLPVAVLASAAGMWLFHVQHCFEGTYWARHAEWDYGRAGMQGSSYYQLPRTLQWLTASIGLHHVHHLDSRIPNYRLQECLDAIPELQGVIPLTLGESVKCATLSLWHEPERRYVRFKDLKGLTASARHP